MVEHESYMYVHSSIQSDELRSLEEDNSNLHICEVTGARVQVPD